MNFFSRITGTQVAPAQNSPENNKANSSEPSTASPINKTPLISVNSSDSNLKSVSPNNEASQAKLKASLKDRQSSLKDYKVETILGNSTIPFLDNGIAGAQIILRLIWQQKVDSFSKKLSAKQKILRVLGDFNFGQAVRVLISVFQVGIITSENFRK